MYLLLVVIVIVAITLNLIINYRVVHLYNESTRIESLWAEQLAEIASLSYIATQANAPGNDVFEPGAIVAEEKEKFTDIFERYKEEHEHVVSQLKTDFYHGIADAILEELEIAYSNMLRVDLEARRIFTYVATGKRSLADVHMVVMDRAYAETSYALNRATSIMRYLQQTTLEQQKKSAEQIVKVQDVIAVFMFFLIAVTIFYGRILSKQIQKVKTQEQQVLQSLKKSETLNRSILENTIDGIITIDTHGEIKSVNFSVSDIFGYKVQEMIGANVSMLMPKGNAEQHDNYLHNYLSSGEKHIIGVGRELIGQHKDGTLFHMDLAISEIISDDEHIFIGVVRDISERKQHEEKLMGALVAADEAARAKSNFLATMSHEIRTPMNGILGMADLLDNTYMDNEQRSYLRTLQQSGKGLLNVINDILDFSKIESGKLELEHIEFNLEEVAFDICRLLSSLASENRIDLILDYAVDCPTHFRSDPGRIRQVLMNLLGNAIKFTERGHVLIKVECIRQQQDTACIQIKIIDTGIGIEKEVQQRLFDAFTQADSSTTRRFGGTGLGLSICKRLLDIMHGSIDVESEPGQGTTFTLQLPLQVTDVPKQLPRLNLHDMHVLIVDDNAVNRVVLAKQLAILGMHTMEAESVPRAYALLEECTNRNEKVDLVITDYIMPDYDGIDLAGKILANPGLSHIPLVLYSSVALKGDAAKFEKEGFSGYITKPILIGTLHDVLTSVLGVKYSNDDKSSPIITRHLVKERAPEIVAEPLTGYVLLVEDNAVNQMVAQAMLEKFGLDIDIANNGEEAVNMYQQHHYDLILMDIQMPVMDGLTATLNIREYEEPGAHIPIIALTANAFSEDQEKYLSSGMDDFLAKPFNKDDIYLVLQKWLNNADTSGHADVQIS